jgi:RNA polymerase sigma-70 factor (ECF subfamily)
MARPDSTRTEEYVELSSSHQRQLLGYLFTLVRNMDDAEDLLQQTNLILWRKFDEYESGTDFMRWACSVAHLEAISFLRRKRRIPLQCDEQLLQQFADKRLSRVKIYENYRESLQQCMERLTDADRELLDLSYGGPLSIREIATKLNRSADSIYHSLQRIRRALFDCVTRVVTQEERTP